MSSIIGLKNILPYFIHFSSSCYSIMVETYEIEHRLYLAIFKPKRIINQNKAIFLYLFELKTKPIRNKNEKKTAHYYKNLVYFGQIIILLKLMLPKVHIRVKY